MTAVQTEDNVRRRRGQSEHSYKFQRLRERIRQAVASGELSGKLPGERELARRFEVNAKTLSKALTDLAAEGLLSRSIGRGTFVKGAEAESTTLGAWLLLCDASVEPSPLLDAMRRQNPRIETVSDVTALRPSFLNQFAAVVDLATNTPEAFIRSLLVRNVPVVIVGRQPRTYSTNAVLLDEAYLAGRLARELIMGGHRQLAAIGSGGGQGREEIARALRATACRYAPDAAVHVGGAAEVMTLIEQGVTALVVDSTPVAVAVNRILQEAAVCVPRVVSVAVIGSADEEFPSTGFYLGADQEAEAIAHLLQHSRAGGSTVLWLTGKYVDQGTIGAAPATAGDAAPVLTLTA